MRGASHKNATLTTDSRGFQLMIQVTGFCFEQTSSAVMVDEPLGKLVQQGVQGAVRSNHNDCTSS